MMSTLSKAGSTTSFPMVSHSPFPKIPVIPLPQRNSPSSFPLPLYPQHIHWEISWGFMGNTMKKKGPDLEIVKKKTLFCTFPWENDEQCHWFSGDITIFGASFHGTIFWGDSTKHVPGVIKLSTRTRSWLLVLHRWLPGRG